MNIVFRTDASSDIGTGHVMRCLTLANAFKKNGAECHFICRENPNNLIAYIMGHGYQVHVLPFDEADSIKEKVNAESDKNVLAHSHWLCATWQTDAAQTSIILEKIKPKWLIVDHYALDTNWERAVKVNSEYLMVIDDLADRLHDCDFLLDQNLGRTSDDYTELVRSDCKNLIGPKYALLRPEFSLLREYSLKRRKNPRLKQILITMGGIDTQNVTGRILDALRICPLPNDCRITVIMGLYAPWLENVQQIASAMPWQTDILMNVSNMAQLMADSDLAIGAAGSTSWERCCLGLPSIMVVLAKNQIEIADALKCSGAALVLNETFSKKNQNDMNNTIMDFIKYPNYLKKMSSIASNVVDGSGVMKVIKQMIG
jgi:UDP-2,4-diacetamido-2,4,6-trideoxy-beta-L-altropyranose hydrolase